MTGLLTLLFASVLCAQNVIRHDTPNSCFRHQIDYDEWEQRSMPIGNGSLGASVMGSVGTECYVLNEKSLWQGGPGAKGGAAHYWDANKEGRKALGAIREAFAEGDFERANALTEENFCGKVDYEPSAEPEFRFGAYTTLGKFFADTDIDEFGVREYCRSLNLDSALALVRFVDAEGVQYERRAFASYPDNVIVLRYTASQRGRQNVVFSYTPCQNSEGTFEPDGKTGRCYRGRLTNNGMAFCFRFRVIARGGKVTGDDLTIRVREADEILVILTADTDYAPNYDPDFADAKAYVGVDPHATTAAWMCQATAKGQTYETLLNRHLDDYTALYDRVCLDLGPTSHQVRELPTDKRLEAYRQGGHDPELEALYYQYGRYLLIASSRPGNLPANLQGIWAEGIDGPWHIDYHNNINIQMNYWPALTTRLDECQKPLHDFIRLLLKPGRETAKAYFGARGWMVGISANPFGFTAPLTNHAMNWNLNPVAAPWLATHLWEYYDFGRDKAFLRDTAFPIMREAALFCEDYLWRRADGHLVAAPSTSPEHGLVDEGVTFAHAVIRELLLDCITAAQVLETLDPAEGIDKAGLGDDIARWQGVLRDILPYQVGRYGQLLEWSRDIDDPEDQHRHVNHLFGLHPGHTISPIYTPELAEAARIVLEHRGDGATGWSMGWKLNQWARLHDGDHAYRLYRNLLSEGTADNLWDMHPPFQIDGNFGGTAGITEMLVQSHAGTLHLLPALPTAWQDGCVSGLGARGGFRVTLRWAGGKLAEALIESLAGEHCTLLYDSQTLDFDTDKGTTYRLCLDAEGRLVRT